MLSRRLIPCLDVREGKVVKGVRFRDHVVMGGIEELVARYRDAGADELVFYDITASSDARRTMVDVVARTAEQTLITAAVVDDVPAELRRTRVEVGGGRAWVVSDGELVEEVGRHE